MNKASPFVIIGTMLFASAGFFWYARQHSSTEIIEPDTNTLIVGTNAEYPPFSFIDNDAIVGFDIDLINEIALRLNKIVELVDMPFDALLPKLQLGDIHVVAAGMTSTPERAQKVLFTRPYINNDPLLIIVPANEPPLKTIEDLKGKDVVVNEGYTADLYLSSFNNINIKRLSTPAEGFVALKSGRAKAFVAAQNSVKPFLDKEAKDKFQIFPLADSSDSYSLAISQKYPELLTEIQQVLDTLQEDGTLAALKTKWNLP